MIKVQPAICSDGSRKMLLEDSYIWFILLFLGFLWKKESNDLRQSIPIHTTWEVYQFKYIKL